LAKAKAKEKRTTKKSDQATQQAPATTTGKGVDLKRVLEAGERAKVKLYNDLLRRIAQGETLSPTQLRVFSVLGQEIEQIADGDRSKKPRRLGSFDDAAKYCGFSKRSLSWHVSRGNITQNADGTFDVSELDRFLEERGRKKQKKTVDYEAKKEAADLRWRLARARREEILIKQMEGELIHIEEIEKKWAQRVAAVCAMMELLAARLPGLLAGKSRREMAKIIENEVWNIRDAYANQNAN